MADNIYGDIPLELQPQMQDISQQQKLSQMLLQQGMQQPQGQMVSGRFVAPALTQYLQPLLAAYAGTKGMETAEQKQLDLAKAIRQVGGQEVKNILETYKTDPNAALQMASIAQTPQAKALAAQLSKSVILEPTPEERKYKAAIADGSFKGGFNAFINQLSEKDKQEIAIQKARLGLAQQEQAWNMGLPIGNVGGGVVGQTPLRTINPGSPILAPNQNPQISQVGIPQSAPQGQIPRFNSKIEQELWLANQKEKGKLQTEAMAALPGAELKVQNALSAINNMIGDTTVDKEGNLVLGKNKPHPGFYEAVGMPSITNAFGLTGLFPGSDVQNFKAEYDKVGGQAFLQAVETLRGTGAISEIEGKKATQAITSMSLAQSEKAFVKAANEFKEAIQKGYVASQQKAGVTPFTPNQNIGGTKPTLRWNPNTQSFE